MSTENYNADNFQSLLDKSAQLADSGNFESAIACLKKSLSQKTTIFSLGISGLKAAFEHKMVALSEFARIVCCSNSLADALDFIHTIKDYRLLRWDQQIENAFLLCLRNQSIDPQNVCLSAIQLLKYKKFSHLDPLFLELMRNCILPDETIEKYLTNQRREALLYSEMLSPSSVFLEAIATQCRINEYVFFVSEDENEAINLTPPPELLDCYQAKNFLLKLNKAIPCVSKIKNKVSQNVRCQYEENPYPKWSRVDFVESFSLEMLLNETFPFLKCKLPEFPKILVAGCGTGKQAIETAIRYKNCIVTAFDLSLASLSYAKMKAEEIGLSNIQFFQGDILEIDEMKESFDLIECSGVLHHMKEPAEGLRLLKNLLKENGFMFLGLYSEIARRNIAIAREFVRRNGYTSTPEGIRQCRKDIFDLPTEDPIRSVVNWTDFYTMSSCRDLLFHVQEVNFNILEVKEMLESLSLNFLGFDLPKLSVRSAYLARHPDDIYLRSLENWHIFENENPDIFSTMYQFWVTHM